MKFRRLNYVDTEDALVRVAIAEDQAREAENKFAAAAKQMAVANARAAHGQERSAAH